jgi:hypothetical protein
MTRDQQRLADYLAHILEAIERIDRYTGGMDALAFLNNQLVQGTCGPRCGCEASTKHATRMLAPHRPTGLRPNTPMPA